MRLADADRDALAAALGRHYAGGALDAGELEARLEALYRAGSREAAAEVLADLPPLAAPPAAGRRRRRGHGEADVPGAGWVPTTERFRDPSTQRVMRVWVDPADDARHYVAEG